MRISLAFILCFATLMVRGQGTPRTLETMAQLLATDPVKFATSGKLVYLVGGYRTNGDWGAPREIAWDAAGSATTNLGCVWATITTNGQWVARDCNGGVVDARWFGADATGTLGSSTAIQAAMDSGAHTVLFPEGTFLIDATLTSPPQQADYTRIHLKGQTKAMTGHDDDDFDTTLKSAPGLNAPILSFGCCHRTAITGIAFDGQRDTQTGFTGVALVELAGGWGALSTDLTDVAIINSKTNGLYILRFEIQFERVKVHWNDGDGIRFNTGGSITHSALADISMQNVQVGYNKGDGLAFQQCYSVRMLNVDTYLNNRNGMRVQNGGVYMVRRLQSNNNGMNGVLLEENLRHISFDDCLIYDSNWNEFDNYPTGSLTAETTNSAASGTYHNLNIDPTGNKIEMSFKSCRFWNNPGNQTKKPGYLLYGQGSLAYTTVFMDTMLHDSTSFFETAAIYPGLTNYATFISTRWNGQSEQTKFGGTVKRTVFTDPDSRGTLTVQRDDPALFMTMERPASGTWATWDLGAGYLRQYQNNGVFQFGNTNPVANYGTRVAYFTMPHYSGTNPPVLLMSGQAPTNAPSSPVQLRLGGGNSTFEGINRLTVFTSTNYLGWDGTNFTDTDGGTERFKVLPQGQVEFTPLLSDPTIEANFGQFYYNTNLAVFRGYGASGWTNIPFDAPSNSVAYIRSNSTWAAAGGPYLPIAGGTPTGPITSSSYLSGTYFQSQGTGSGMYMQTRGATNNQWVVYSQTILGGLKMYWHPNPGTAYDVFTFATNGGLSSVAGTFWHSGNDGSGSGLDADKVQGLAYPTNNGAYILFVTNGVASWIAHP